jgi:hypothetical protein
MNTDDLFTTTDGPLTLWLRLGDGGGYEDFGQDLGAVADALAEVGVVASEIEWLAGPPDPVAYAAEHGLVFLPLAGLRTPAFCGNDYVSLFWGDGDGNLVRPLDPAEQRDLVGPLAVDE